MNKLQKRISLLSYKWKVALLRIYKLFTIKSIIFQYSILFILNFKICHFKEYKIYKYRVVLLLIFVSNSSKSENRQILKWLNF